MPMLDLWPDQLVKTTHFDPEMSALADRHYSRRTVGARQFCYSGRKLVLRDAAALVLWVWMFPDPSMRMDGQTGYNCAIFRNESPRRSSDIILEAEQRAMRWWGPNRMYTYIRSYKGQEHKPRLLLPDGRMAQTWIQQGRKGAHGQVRRL